MTFLSFLRRPRPALGSRRVVGRATWVTTPGYIDSEEIRLNVLQEYRGTFGRFLPRWVDVDTEEVPSHVSIAIGALGYDASQWASRFAGMPGVAFQ